jgi:hypothetical protein
LTAFYCILLNPIYNKAQARFHIGLQAMNFKKYLCTSSAAAWMKSGLGSAPYHFAVVKTRHGDN